MNTKYCSKCGVGATSEVKFCANCGSDQFAVNMAATPVQPVQPGVAPVQPVAPVGGQAPKGGMPTWAKVLLIIGIIFLLMGGCAVGCTMYVGKKATDFVNGFGELVEEDLGEAMEELEEEVESQLEEQANENTSSQTLGSTFTFDDLELTLGTDVQVITVDDATSAYNGRDIVKVPIKIKNTSLYEHKLKSFYYSIYNGETKLNSLGLSFEDSVDNADELASEQSYDKYIYFFYQEDGTYKVQFYDYVYTINVEFNVTK